MRNWLLVLGLLSVAACNPWNREPTLMPAPDQGAPGPVELRGDLSAAELKTALVGKWDSAYMREKGRSVQRARFEADGTAEESATTHPARGPATLSANLSSLPSAARPSVQNCMTDAARQIGVTGGTRLSYDKLVSLEQGNGGWRIRATMTATYPDGAKQVEMYCRATPSEIIQLDFT